MRILEVIAALAIVGAFSALTPAAAAWATAIAVVALLLALLSTTRPAQPPNARADGGAGRDNRDQPKGNTSQRIERLNRERR